MEYEGERWVQGAEAQAVKVEAKVNTLEVKTNVQEAE